MQGFPDLSVLICHLSRRSGCFSRLWKQLGKQLDRVSGVEVLIDSDNGDVTIGEKRNRLLERARGNFTCFIDDDDQIAETYLDDVLFATRMNPYVDVVGIRGVMYIEEKFHRNFIWSLSKKDCVEEGSLFAIPQHLNPIAARHSRSIPFPPINLKEDHQWAKAVFPLLHDEVLIDHPIYFYHRSYRKKELLA